MDEQSARQFQGVIVPSLLMLQARRMLLSHAARFRAGCAEGGLFRFRLTTDALRRRCRSSERACGRAPVARHTQRPAQDSG